MGSLIKRYLPKSLLGRSLMIIVTPLVLLQVLSAVIFFESHWDKVTYRLARGVAGDISAVITLMHRNPGAENMDWIADMASDTMEISMRLKPGEILSNRSRQPSGILETMLARALDASVRRPFRIDTESLDRYVIIDVQLKEGILSVVTPRKRLFSSTTYVFVLWMVGLSMVLFGVATIFMRNQVKPIRRLAIAADNFGKGRDVTSFKPEGAQEVRQAAAAFLAMRERILRQIGQRTDMLSGVSHDLRTPLTRMKLQLEMLGDTDGAADLKHDVGEMEHMLEGYLAFARGEGTEKPEPTNLTALLEDVASSARRKGTAIDLHCEGDLLLPLRPQAFKRCVTNLLDNAARYGEHVSMRAGPRDDAIELSIDDDGPGIPPEHRAEVFKPFFRVDASRNPETGGVGLGLTIARDVIQSHGGEISLDESPGGGLRVRVRMPY